MNVTAKTVVLNLSMILALFVDRNALFDHNAVTCDESDCMYGSDF